MRLAVAEEGVRDSSNKESDEAVVGKGRSNYGREVAEKLDKTVSASAGVAKFKSRVVEVAAIAGKKFQEKVRFADK